MDDPTELYEHPPVFLGPNDVDCDTLVCTQCRGSNLIVSGRVSYPFTEVLVAGEVISHDRDELHETNEQIDQFYCVGCKLNHFFITQHCKDLVDNSDELKDVLKG
jgi:hypothetical protein